MSLQPTTPLSSRILPARHAAKKAAASFTEQLSSPTSDQPDSTPTSPFGEPSQAKARVTKRYGGRGRFKGHDPIATPTLNRTTSGDSVTQGRLVKTKRGRKRRAKTPSDLGDTDESDFTDPFTSLFSDRPSANTTPRRRHTLAAIPPFQQRPSNGHVAPPTTPSASSQSRKPPLPEKWDLSKLDTFVWVLVNKNVEFTQEEGVEEDSHSDPKMWWPAKISSRNGDRVPLCVTLFGVSLKTCDVEIRAPSEHNIQPMFTSNGDLRFNSTTYLRSDPVADIISSPRKKHKSSILSSWQAAVDTMLKEYHIDNDGLPSVDLAYSETLYGSLSASHAPDTVEASKSREKLKGKRGLHSTSSADALDRWSPPPPDLTLSIPGELVLAREPRGSLYWPAVLKSYVPPTNPRSKPKYRVRYLDESTADLARDAFFTSVEDGFSLCKMGVWESSYKDVVNDDVDDVDLHKTDEELRKPSPMPVLPVPEKFCELTIEEQFVYTKPILVAILNEAYPPARKRHDDFIKGGSARRHVTENACARGTIVPEDIDRLQGRLLWWALRDEQRAKIMVDIDDDLEGRSLIVVEDGEGNRGGGEACQDATAMDDDQLSDLSSLPSSGNEVAPSSLATDLRSSEHGSRQHSPTHKPARQREEGATRVSREDAGTPGSPRENAKLSDDAFPPHGPRQRGCEAYEALSCVEKIEYCSNVLLPEAVLQILLWRSGERESVDVLGVQEEQRLYALGSLKMQETDWVQDVMRLREVQVRLRRKKEGVLDDAIQVGGTRSRPKRVAASRR